MQVDVGMIKLTPKDATWQNLPYYAVEVYLDTWTVSGNLKTWNSIKSWCDHTYGNPGDIWVERTARWYCNNGTFYFKKEQDRTLFLMRWTNETVT